MKLWRKNYYNDPVGFAKNVCGVSPTPKQIEIMLNVMKNKKVAVKSCNGSGKSFTIAVLTLWFLTTRWRSNVVLTSNTYSQLENTTFAELERVFNGSKLKKYEIFELKDCELRINSDEFRNTWHCVGISPTEEEKLQGNHVKEGLLFMVDESSGDGLTEGIFRALIGSSDENTYMLFSGNPTRSFGVFFDLFSKYKHIFKCMTLTFRDRPDDFLKFEQTIIDIFGKDSPEYRVRCMGEFVDVSDCTVISRKLVDEAIERDKKPRRNSDINIGVDFGRIKDNTVFCVMQDNVEIERKILTNRDQVHVANEVRDLVKKYEFETNYISVRVDSTGSGDGISRVLIRDPFLNTRKELVDIFPINFSYRANNNGVYASITTEMFFEFQKLLRSGEVSLIKDDYTERLIEELVSRRYEYSNDNKYKVESKDKYISRSKKSPDIADALLLATMNTEGRYKAVIGSIERY